MAEQTKIEWCDATFNPWHGCTKVSDGCANCYAEALMDHRYHKSVWGNSGTRVRTSEAYWKKPITWNRKCAKEGRRMKVFCASLCDIFEDHPRSEVSSYLAAILWDLFDLIEQTPHLDWLLLTKRPARMREYLDWRFKDTGPWPHVWCGVSVEDQRTWDDRVGILESVPAALRFVSVEPMLGPLDVYDRWLYPTFDRETIPGIGV